MQLHPLSSLLCGLFLFAAPVLHADQVYAVNGVVRAPLDAGQIVIENQEIAGYMPAMTMGFDVAGGAMMAASRLKPGDHVQFLLHVAGAQALADSFRVLSQGEAATAPETLVDPAIRRLQDGDPVPDFRLEDEEGRPLTRATLDGHLTLITFIYTRCPDPRYCPLMATRFGQLQEAILADSGLKGRFHLLSITLDPSFDRPMVLKNYGIAVGANSEVWGFGSGSGAQIERLVQAFSVYRQRNGVLLDHTLCTALVASTGRIVEVWRGNDWKIADVLALARSQAARAEPKDSPAKSPKRS